ncbi:D-isomer specific 2-hydroxyacid dehydrogenase [Lanmaoa asiatica]|nr:D-isomer specific 2-hydroxyacid dehydrogenase [Lanmaoa asiatica]
MARKSTRRVPQGRARSSTPIHTLTAIKQPSVSIARSKQQRKQEYFKRQRRRLAFAAQREKRSEWVETARDTQRIVLGDGKYITQRLSAHSSASVASSPFQYAMPVAMVNPQGNVPPNVVHCFYNIAPQIVISQQGTTFYPHCSPDLANWRGHRASAPTSESSTVQFVPKSTLTAARHLITENPRFTRQYPNALPTSFVGVLSFASAKRPGGGFLHGGDEQEETLARSTSLVASLRSAQAKEFYRTHRKFLNVDGAGLHDHSMVYTPGVVAFRRDDDDDVDVDPAPSCSSSTIAPYLINVLSSVPVNAAAIRQNYLITSSDAHVFEEGIRNTMRDRMARALRIFEIRGNRALVLGAFGCGSGQNSGEMVAELWAELLVCGSREGSDAGKEETAPAKFKGVFEKIVFAVPGKLFAPFKRAFEMKVLEMEVMLATIPEIQSTGSPRWALKEVHELFDSIAQVIVDDAPNRADFFARFQPGGPYEGTVGIYRRNISAARIGIYDRDLVAGLPSSVQWIAHNGAGYDLVDVHACKEKGIRVSNTPGAVDDATATTALYLVLSTLRHFSKAERSLRAGTWKIPISSGDTHDLTGHTLGILGLGGIGLRLAHLVHAFPMRVVYHNRRRVADAPEWCEYMESLEELCARSDVLSIHVPLREDTKGLVGERQIRAMKRGSILVNTARGKVLEEEAVIRALEDGHLASVGLDVFPDEPQVNPRLLEFPQNVLLPHVGTRSQDTERKMEVRAMTNLRDFLLTGSGKDLVPELR